MPRKHFYWILAVMFISALSVWCADPYAGTFRYVVRKVRSHAIRPLSERELFDAGVSGLLAAVDENSSYIPPQTYDELNHEFLQEIGTAGILCWKDPETNRVFVGSVLPFSSARTVGIMPNDELLTIDGQSLSDLSPADIQKKINVPVGREITVEIMRPVSQSRLSFVVASQKIPLESVKGFARKSDGTWEFLLPPFSGQNENSPVSAKNANSNILYVKLDSFGEKTVQEMRNILKKGNRENRDGLILDLRGNGGGLLNAAIDVCGMFLPDGCAVVNLKNAHSDTQEPIFSSEKRIWKKPVVILMDGDTASASEILAACLQDYGKKGIVDAICVGSRTYGKGTIQEIFDLGPIPDDRYLANENAPKTLWQKIWEKPLRGGFRISVSTYLSPDGRQIHRFPDSSTTDEWGVLPNEGQDVSLTDHPLWKKNRKQFIQDWIALNCRRDSGGLPRDEWNRIFDFDPALKRAAERFQENASQNHP